MVDPRIDAWVLGLPDDDEPGAARAAHVTPAPGRAGALALDLIEADLLSPPRDSATLRARGATARVSHLCHDARPE